MPEAAQPPPSSAPAAGAALVRPSPPVPWGRRLLDALAARFPVPSVAPRRILGVLLTLLVLAVVGVTALRPVLGSARSGPPPEDSLPRARAPQSSPAAGSAAVAVAGSAGGPAAPVAGGEALVVHVAGAVAIPGVHEVKAGGRVIDAIHAAGGPAADADLDALDLAAKVTDGQRVYVPRRGEVQPGGVVDTGGAGSGAADGTPVDINTATADDLDKLPGVGPSLAGAILEYRRRHGPFHSVDQLLEVPGIGEAKLASLRPKVRI